MTTVTNKNGVEFDIDALATDLNGKADVDLMNINNTGASVLSEGALPSNTSVDLTIGARGTSYYAPANGYFLIRSEVRGYTGSFVGWALPSYGGQYPLGGYSWFQGGAVIPVLKGQSVVVEYESNVVINYIKFCYAKGSESEAS